MNASFFKKYRKIHKKFILVELIAALLLVGCEPETIQPTQVMTRPPLIIALEASPTPTPSATITLTATSTHVLTATIVPTLTPQVPTVAATEVVISETDCVPPAGWIAHTVQAGDTLFAFQLGSENTATVDDILAANCTTDRFLFEGQVIWLPPGAAENAPSSVAVPTAMPLDPNAPPPPQGLTRSPNCPCEITIQPGWRIEQIAEVIDSLQVGFYGRDFLAAARSLPARDFLAGAGSVEGYMLAGAYTITNEMNATAFRDMVLDAFAAATAGFWGDAAARGFTPYQMVILASIIIKESRAPNEQVLVSSVFHNRLASGRGLGATVTVQYALGRPGNWWPNVNGLVSTTDSPYNTNLYTGLPPSPISNPNIDALRAAVYPAQTNYLFFTGKCGGGGNAYAETYEQHLANARCE